MPIRTKSYGQLHWTKLLLACPAPRLGASDGGMPGSTLPVEQEERVANSKLDRLADELRALGIQF